MIESKEQNITNVWTDKKPDKPCVFITRNYIAREGRYEYIVWRLEKVSDGDGKYYLAWLTETGDEWDDYAECNYNEYLILEYL